MEAIDTCIILDQWNARTFLTITTCQYGKKKAVPAHWLIQLVVFFFASLFLKSIPVRYC